MLEGNSTARKDMGKKSGSRQALSAPVERHYIWKEKQGGGRPGASGMTPQVTQEWRQKPQQIRSKGGASSKSTGESIYTPYQLAKSHSGEETQTGHQSSETRGESSQNMSVFERLGQQHETGGKKIDLLDNLQTPVQKERQGTTICPMNQKEVTPPSIFERLGTLMCIYVYF